jgi:drug/metabolite transporter (DMT)-like permease
MSRKSATSFLTFRQPLRTAGVIGPLLMLSSGFLFAVTDGLIKFMGPSWRVWDIAFYRFGCGMAILLLVSGWRHNPFAGDNPKLLVFRGIAGSIAFLAEVFAIRLIPISTALVLFYTFPAFAALFSMLLMKEETTKELLWVLLSLCGVAVFLDFKLEGGILGQLMSLLGAAFAGAAVTSVKKLRETNGPVIIYFYFCLTGAAIAIVPFASNPQLPSSVQEWLFMAGIVGLSLIAQLLMNQGFLYCKSWEGGLLLTSEVLFVSLWGIIFLSETVSWRFWTGGTMILASIIALNYSAARRVPFPRVTPARNQATWARVELEVKVRQPAVDNIER